MEISNIERNRVADRAAKTAHDTIERLHEQATQVEDQIRAKAVDAGNQAFAQGQRFITSVEGAVQSVTDYIRQNPLTSAAAAFVVGVAFTSMVRFSGRKPASVAAGPAADPQDQSAGCCS
jgi:ElaB/YqjD/DUF883 family membrane-anchored ribosome-binding protein